MFPSADHATACGQAALSTEAARRPRKFWFSIVRIAVIEVVVLAALADVFVAYLNWSSEASFAEFMAVSKMQASPSSAPHAVKASWRCDRNA